MGCPIKYSEGDWELAANNLLVHRPTKTGFEIIAVEDNLHAFAVHLENDEWVTDDVVEELAKVAVRAYWDVIGFGKTALVVDGPKPN